MSVKTMLPLLGVGSAFAILGLAAARRRSNNSVRAAAPSAGADERSLSSGVHPRVMLDDDADDANPAAPLTSEFWDAAPESYSLAEESMRASPGTFEAYDAIDTEDLSAEWLSRATEAPLVEDWSGDADDPAEIPADSLSMISDASRHAAAFEYDGDEERDEDLAER
jgi:hypothetical protein